MYCYPTSGGWPAAIRPDARSPGNSRREIPPVPPNSLGQPEERNHSAELWRRRVRPSRRAGELLVRATSELRGRVRYSAVTSRGAHDERNDAEGPHLIVNEVRRRDAIKLTMMAIAGSSSRRRSSRGRRYLRGAGDFPGEIFQSFGDGKPWLSLRIALPTRNHPTRSFRRGIQPLDEALRYEPAPPSHIALVSTAAVPCLRHRFIECGSRQRLRRGLEG